MYNPRQDAHYVTREVVDWDEEVPCPFQTYHWNSQNQLGVEVDWSVGRAKEPSHFLLLYGFLYNLEDCLVKSISNF